MLVRSVCRDCGCEYLMLSQDMFRERSAVVFRNSTKCENGKLSKSSIWNCPVIFNWQFDVAWHMCCPLYHPYICCNFTKKSLAIVLVLRLSRTIKAVSSYIATNLVDASPAMWISSKLQIRSWIVLPKENLLGSGRRRGEANIQNHFSVQGARGHSLVKCSSDRLEHFWAHRALSTSILTMSRARLIS
jgi:hypothetical protein